MNTARTLSEWMKYRGMSIAELTESSGLDGKVVEAIVEARYTTSPQQRQRLANALGTPPEEIIWGRPVEVDHLYGHGPQFGRSP